MPPARLPRVNPTQVAQVRRFVRRFNTFSHRLSARFVDDYSLTECRVLFAFQDRPELAVVDLRAELEIDSGYLSRILARFDREGLVRRERSQVDRRRQHAVLTEEGARKLAELDDLANLLVHDLLGQLEASDRDDLAEAMARLLALLDAQPVVDWLTDQASLGNTRSISSAGFSGT